MILVYKGAPGYKKAFDGHQIGTEKEYTKEKADEVMRDYPGSFEIVGESNAPKKEMNPPANKTVFGAKNLAMESGDSFEGVDSFFARNLSCLVASALKPSLSQPSLIGSMRL